MQPETETGCCGLWVVKSPPSHVPLCRGLAPRGARGHVAAVPRLPLGCGVPVPSQGLDTVWWAQLGTWLSIRAGEPRDPEAGQVLGLFLRGWKGKRKPVGLSGDLE